MKQGLAGALLLCLAAWGTAEVEAQDAGAALSSAETLPDDFSAESLGRLEAIRSLVAGHRKNIPPLLRALKGSDSWKVRMAACYALKEMGFQSLLVAAVEDANPLVRTFARVVLVSPPVSPSEATPENTKHYAIDGAYRDRAEQLARVSAALDPRERAERLEAVVADLLAPGEIDPTLPYGSDPHHVAKKLALQDPAGSCAGILKSVAGKDDAALKLQALEILGTLATLSPSSRGAIYELSKDFLATALADKDGRVRSSVLSSLASLAPLDLRFDVVLRLTKDSDESVRIAAAAEALELIEDLEAAGNPKKADDLLDQMARLSASKGAPPDFDRTLAETKARLDHERELLHQGETVRTNKGVRLDRYLRVDRRLVDVTPEEYDAAMARYGKPYVTEKQFRELRAEGHERTQRKNEEQAMRHIPVEVGPAGRAASPPGKTPEDRAAPAEGTREKASGEPRSSYRSAGFLVILAVLGWLIFRVRRKA